MVIRRGEIWSAALPDPIGSEAGHQRPVIVLQNDGLNASGLYTTIAVPLTSVLANRHLSGNVVLTPRQTGLSKMSLAVTTLIDNVEKSELFERVGTLDDKTLWQVEAALLQTLSIER